MTQPPYVPPRDDDSTTTPVWPTPTQEATYDEAAYVEPVSSVAVGGTYTDETYSNDQGPQSTKDVAKDQAGNVKDTAVQQGQQVAGVAKEQAGAVKDTAVEQGQHVAGVAKEQAGAVKDTVLEEGQHVAGVAKEQVAQVASEAGAHVRDLLDEGLSEIRSQAGSQQKRLATGIHSLADELGTMASKSDKSGPLTDYAKQLSHRGGEAAHWLENAEPAEVLDSLRSFARRRPAVFLGLSALAGVVAGRLTRGLVSNAKDEKEQSALGSSYPSAQGTTAGYPATDYATTTADYSTTPTQYGVEAGTTPYTQDVAGTGYSEDVSTTGYSYTSDQDYAAGQSTPSYGSTGNDGVAR
jgi:hypothetical protein